MASLCRGCKTARLALHAAGPSDAGLPKPLSLMRCIKERVWRHPGLPRSQQGDSGRDTSLMHLWMNAATDDKNNNWGMYDLMMFGYLTTTAREARGSGEGVVLMFTELRE